MSRAELYQKLLKAAARQLGVKPSSESAKDLAVLRLARETITSKLISGRDCDPSALKWLAEELAKFTPPPEIPRVDIAFVEGIVGICPVCKAEIPDYTPPPTPAPPSPPSSPPPTETSSPAPSAPPAPSTNVVPIKRAESNAAPVSETMRAWNRLQGYSIAPDGRLGKGNSSRGGSVW